jgi:hypothetical protein
MVNPKEVYFMKTGLNTIIYEFLSEQKVNWNSELKKYFWMKRAC